MSLKVLFDKINITKVTHSLNMMTIDLPNDQYILLIGERCLEEARKAGAANDLGHLLKISHSVIENGKLIRLNYGEDTIHYKPIRV